MSSESDPGPMQGPADDVASLSALNKATLLGKGNTNQDLPVVTTASGVTIPTGTVGTLLVNIKLYDDAHAKGDKEALSRLEQAVTQPVPMLKAIGLFELFSPEEWMAGGGEGRKLVGRKAKELGF